MISLVPMNFVGDSAIKYAQQAGIELSSQTNWNLRLLGLKANTGKITYRFNLDGYEISGYGENFTFGLTNHNINFDNLIVDLLIDKKEEMTEFFEKIISKIKDKYVSISATNLTINIYAKNENDEKNIIEELLFNNFEITKTKEKASYRASASTGKEENIEFLLKQNNIGKKNYETNGKLEGKNIECFLYSNEKTEEFNCKTGNFLKLLNEVGFNVKDDDLKKILKKSIKIVANATKDKNNERTTLSGSFVLNGSVGQISTDKEGSINLKFKDINFDDVVKDEENEEEDDEEDKKTTKKEEWHKLAMSGEENKFIEGAKKKGIQENINFVSKIIKTFYTIFDRSDFKIKTEIDTATINSQQLKNIIISTSKSKNSNISFAGTRIYNANAVDLIEIKNFDDENDIFTFAGTDIKNLFALFNSPLINKELNTNSYIISGKLALKTNGFEFKNVEMTIDDAKIATINLSKYHNSLNKIVSTKKSLVVQNVNINEIFDLKPFYKKYYDKFELFQQKNEQEPIFWQKLFEKRKKKTSRFKYESRIILDNVLLENIKIENFLYELNDGEKNTELTISALSPFLKGTAGFSLKNIDEKETINGDVKIDKIEMQYLNDLNNSLKTATGKNIEEIFFEDKEYNIPSFLGINGNINLNINFAVFSQNNTIQNLSSNFTIKDGTFETNDFTAEYGNGKISGNVVLFLRERPQINAGIVLSGIDIKKTITPYIGGLLSVQMEISSSSFNPIDFIKRLNGKGKFVINNLSIPNFNIQAIGIDSIKNGINKTTNYLQLIERSNLKFPQAEGNFIMENGIITANMMASTELVSCNANLEYIFTTQIIKKLFGIFAVVISRNKFESPMQIYIPYACNETILNPSCIFDLDQLNKVIKSIN